MGNQGASARSSRRRDIRIVETSIQGRRSTQEDRHIFIESIPNHPDVAFFAIFDGHNGDSCAEFCKNNLHVEISNRINKKGTITPKDLEEAFINVDNRFLEVSGNKNTPDEAGCTVVVAVYNRVTGQLIAGNCGDARCLLSRSGKAQGMTIDHKPFVTEERRRIETAGRRVEMNRLDGCLAVSRALGDLSLKIEFDKNGCRKTNPNLLALSPVPYVQETVLNDEDDFIVLACDGLFDVMSNQQVVDWIKTNRDRTSNTRVLSVASLPEHDEDDNGKTSKKPPSKMATLLKGNNIAQMLATDQNKDGAAGGNDNGGDARKEKPNKAPEEIPEEEDTEDAKLNLANELARHALKQGSMDNISIILVFLDAIPAANKSAKQRKQEKQKETRAEQARIQKEMQKQARKQRNKEKLQDQAYSDEEDFDQEDEEEQDQGTEE